MSLSTGSSAAAWALTQVDAVRDDPAGRLELSDRAYHGPAGSAPRHLPFRRAALSFMRWQLSRGVLEPLDAAPPGSPWWRAVNERLLRDGCEALARSGGLGGTPSSHTIDLWMSFVADPTARTWYRAHNASIVSAYLDHCDLASGENDPERFFLNARRGDAGGRRSGVLRPRSGRLLVRTNQLVHRSLGPEAAAVCLQAGRTDRAVELFEQGRAVLFSQMLAARSDLTDLQQAHEELAILFIMLRDRLDGLQAGGELELSSTDIENVPAASVLADQRRRLADDFDQVLKTIRSKPNFDRFLRPRQVSGLLPAAADGPVVLLNVSNFGSAALIMTSDGVEPFPLARLSPTTVNAEVATFLQALDEIHDPRSSEQAPAPASAEDRLTAVLRWLGKEITGPILNHLGYTEPPADGAPWPRVWWCPSGPLSLLPIHAAGDHSVLLTHAADTPVIDRVVSTTIPNLRSLLEARATQPHAQTACPCGCDAQDTGFTRSPLGLHRRRTIS